MNAAIRTTCTDSNTRAAYRLLLSGQIAMIGSAQAGGLFDRDVRDMQRSVASAIAQCRRWPKSRTAHRPSVIVSCF